ncbi:MAG: thioesterase domain-containing protein [Solirubrobacterales bacterium]
MTAHGQWAAAPGEPILAEFPNLILLRKGTVQDKYLFLVHPGSGELDGYLGFSRLLDEQFTVVGIRAHREPGLAPRVTTIAEMAREYAGMIQRLQPHGIINLAGWCFGGTVAAEIAMQFESAGRLIGRLGVINTGTPTPGERDNWQPLSLATERALVEAHSAQMLAYLDQAADMESFWQTIAGLVNADIARAVIPSLPARAIPRIQELEVGDIIYYLNTVRSFMNAQAGYSPKSRLQTRVFFIEAEDDRELIPDKAANRQRWQAICSQPIRFYRTAGDHFNMFRPPRVEELAKAFNRAFHESSAPTDKIE